MSGGKYEEDLCKNEIFIKLKNDYRILIETAAASNWIICVPRTGSVDPTTFFADENFVLYHVLVPDGDVPDFHFIDMLGERYERKDDILANKSTSGRRKVLFEEFYYTGEMTKLRIWCLSEPFKDGSPIQSILHDLETVQDASWFITKETDVEVLGVIRATCRRLLKTLHGNGSCCDLKSALKEHSAKCIDVILTRKSYKYLFAKDPVKMKNLKRATVILILYWTYDYCFHHFVSLNIGRSEFFNRCLQKAVCYPLSSSALQNRQPTETSLQISALYSLKTPLEKISIFKKILNTMDASLQSSSLDDLIPIIAGEMINSDYPHWIACVAYIIELLPVYDITNNGYEQFLLSTLEAVLCYVEKYLPSENQKIEKETFGHKSKEDFLEKLFSLIKSNDEVGVLSMFNVPFSEGDDILSVVMKYKTAFHNVVIDQQLDLCHPLCGCINCRAKIEEHVPTINSKGKEGLTALHIASLAGYPKLVTALLTLGADVNSCDKDGRNALHFAAIGGHQNVLLLLLNSKAEINKKTIESKTVLHLAATSGQIGCVKAVLFYADYMNARLDINARDLNGNTALHIAAKWGFLEIVESLLEYKAELDVHNNSGKIAINLAHNAKIRSLLSTSALVVDPDEVDSSVKPHHIFRAIRRKDVQLFRFYTGLAADPEIHPQKNVANIDRITQSGQGVLHFACLVNCIEIVKDLLKDGLEIDTVDKNGRTPLHLACKEGNVECALEVLKYANTETVNRQDNLGNTVLHYSVSRGLWGLVQSLLQHSCVIHIKNNNQFTPIDIAMQKHHLTILALFEKFK